MPELILKIHPENNVIVAFKDLSKGQQLTYGSDVYELQNDIPAKHKFFTHDMQEGDEVSMYGVLVVKTQFFIAKGRWLPIMHLQPE